MDSNEKVVLRTVLYADIFNAPISLLRLHKFLITSKPLSFTDVSLSINKLIKKKIIEKEKDNIFIKNRYAKIAGKMNSENFYNQKRYLSKKAALILSKVKTIKFIGISGGLASGTITDSDDIDFFIIAQKGTLWWTRLLSLLFLQRYGLRRKRNDSIGKNKICLNMFISIDALSFPPNRRDVYTAVEIAQMIPLFSQGKTYERFLEKNSWIKNHLANFSPEEPILLVEEDKKYYVNKGVLQFAKLLQLPFIFMHKTTEIVTETLFAFHPRDYRTYVLEEYNKRLKSYSL